MNTSRKGEVFRSVDGWARIRHVEGTRSTRETSKQSQSEVAIHYSILRLQSWTLHKSNTSFRCVIFVHLSFSSRNLIGKTDIFLNTRQKRVKELRTAPLEVQLSDESVESLKLLKPEGDLFRDRDRNLVERGIVEPRFGPNKLENDISWLTGYPGSGIK